MTGLRVTKNVKEIKFEVIWCKLEAKMPFAETIIASINKICIWQEHWALSYHSIKF